MDGNFWVALVIFIIGLSCGIVYKYKKNIHLHNTYFKKLDLDHLLLYIFGITLIVVQVIKIIVLFCYSVTTTKYVYDIDDFLPLQVCSYPMLLLPMLAFVKKEKIKDNLIFCWVGTSIMTVGAILFFPDTWDKAITKFSNHKATPNTVFSFIYHVLILLFSSFIYSAFYKKLPTPKFSIIYIFSIMNAITMFNSIIFGNIGILIYGGQDGAHGRGHRMFEQTEWLFHKFGGTDDSFAYSYDFRLFHIFNGNTGQLVGC